MSEREKFINALKANEDDTPVRLAFADWLDEQGEHEEANRHRKWTAAKAWIIAFCEDHQPNEEFDALDSLTYTAIMEMALAAAAEANEHGGGIHCGGNMDLSYSGQWKEFWKNWSIVSGIPMKQEVIDNMRYGCAC